MPSITPKLADSVARSLYELLFDESRAVETEIQDGGEFLLVQVELNSNYSADDLETILRKASVVMIANIAPRKTEHAWMVNLTYRKSLLDSNVGGLLRD
jgi:hypothetical protein